MKNILFEISQQEKNRILEMHKKATSNNYLTEAAVKTECLEGDCTNGKGKQKITTSIGNYKILEGTFKGGKLNGQGKYTQYYDEVVHNTNEGSFKDGELNGQGKMEWFRRGVDKLSYYENVIEQGNFKDGKLYQGKRTYYKNGFVDMEKEGNFKDGDLNGQGKFTNKNGCVFEGKFKGTYPNNVMTFNGKDYNTRKDPNTGNGLIHELKCKRGDVNNFDDKMQPLKSLSDIGNELQKDIMDKLPSSIQGEIEPYKFTLKNPDDGVQDIFYNFYTGDITTPKGGKYSKAPSNMSKDDVMDWFKRNKVKITKDKLDKYGEKIY